MSKFFKKNLWVLMILVCSVVNGQPLPEPIRDMTAVPVAYEAIREADAAFQWTLERVIDTREKQNLALNWPHNNLRSLVYNAVLSGQVSAYQNNRFDAVYPDSVLGNLGQYCHYIQIPCSDDPNEICDSFICEAPQIDKMVKWKIVEEWIFDKETSCMVPRIVGLALMYRPLVGGQELPETPLFWVKYEDIRPQLAQNRILNVNNERASISFDHFFQARMFSSYVTKYPNPFDFQISEMEEFADNPLAALYESEKVRLRLFETEHDLWEY